MAASTSLKDNNNNHSDVADQSAAVASRNEVAPQDQQQQEQAQQQVPRQAISASGGSRLRALAARGASIAALTSRPSSTTLVAPDPVKEIFVLPQKPKASSSSRSKSRRESRMFLVDGQLCWENDILSQQQQQQQQQQDSGSGASPPPPPPLGASNLSLSSGSKRNSSVVNLTFGSSMDLGTLMRQQQSMDSSGAGSASDEAISYRIKWCRDNIIQLKRQTWPMEKKLQVLKASKLFIKRHQGELKQSKQARDVLASSGAIFERYWRHLKRELANYLVIITPWEMRIKKIESHFGSVVASYFTFLRWIFWLNLANSLVMIVFVMVPELIENVPDLTGMRKGELGMSSGGGGSGGGSGSGNYVNTASGAEFNPTLSEIWEFEGFLKFSPLFYGYYSNVEISRSGVWRNPLAFLVSAMLTYLFCFYCISRKLSQNTKMSRIGSKDDEYTFCWTVFVGWDFMIGNSETAYNKSSSLIMNLKEGILEEQEQTKKDRNWRLIIRRVLANVLTIMLIVASAYVVTLAVQRSESLPEDASLLQKNELQLVMSGIQFMFPPLFDVIGVIEQYHPRKALSWQLGRILFLDFLNFYTLMFSLFGTVDQMSQQLNELSTNITQLRQNATYYENLFTTITPPPPPPTTTVAPSSVISVSSYFNETSSLFVHDKQTDVGRSDLASSTTTTTTSNELANGTTSSTSIVPSASNATNLITSILLASTSTEMGLSSGAPLWSTQLEQFQTSTTAATITSSIINSTLAPTTGQSVQTSNLNSWATSVSLPGGDSEGAQTTPTPSTNENDDDDDDDYLDIQHMLTGSGGGSAARMANSVKRRPKRRLREQSHVDDPIERDDSMLMQHLEVFNRDQLIAGRDSALNSQQEQLIAGLPPIRDPYDLVAFGRRPSGGGLGATTRHSPFKQTERILSPVDKHGGRDEGLKREEDSENDEEEEEEEEEEEPLEGRLQIKAAATWRRPESTGQSRSSPVRPPNIGGSSSSSPVPAEVVSLSSQIETSPRLDLDSDLREPLTSTPAQVGEHDAANLEEVTTPSLISSSSSSSSSSSMDSTKLLSAASGDSSAVAANGRATSRDSSSGDTRRASADSSSAQSNNISRATTRSLQQQQQQQQTQSANSNSENKTTMATPVQLNETAAAATTTTTTSKSTVDDDDKCIEIPKYKYQEILALSRTLKDKLKTLCWETMFGQEMVKIVVMDLVMTIVSAVSFEFMRACFVRYCNRFFFWDLERGLPGYQDFKLAENVLHLVNNQSTVWMGMFFAPGLPAINTIKLAVLMYVRSWAVLTCNIPHETVFKVNKSNNFYYWILLINLLICILPVAYAVTWIRPSWHCGPFGGECRMYLVVTKLLKQLLPPEANSVFRYMTSPGAIVPILIVLILIIYYLASTVSSSKEANKELKAQLKKDKELEASVPEITSTTVVVDSQQQVDVAHQQATMGTSTLTETSNSFVEQQQQQRQQHLAPLLGAARQSIPN